ncbi:MAG: helix-turn-helix domain-containing protein [Candidatus Paceibacterota bacterium]
MTTPHSIADSITDGRRRALLDVPAVAEFLLCSERHVRRMADAGRMPRPIKLGSLVRWNRATIEQWVADGCPNCRNVAKGARR